MDGAVAIAVGRPATGAAEPTVSRHADGVRPCADITLRGRKACEAALLARYRNDGWGFVAVDGGRIFVTDSSVTDSGGGSFRGLYASETGRVWGENTAVTSNVWSLLATEGGQISWIGGELASEITGGMYLDHASQVLLYGVEQIEIGSR